MNFQKARGAVDEMTRTAEQRLANAPGMEQIRRELLQKAQIYYQGFLEESSDEPTVRQETGRAYRRVGDIHKILGEYEQAEQAYRSAMDVFDKLAVDFPDAADHRMEIAVSGNGLGLALRALGRHQQAEEAFIAASALLEALAEESDAEPTCAKALAEAYNNLGLVLMDTGKPEEAKQAYHQALAIREDLVTQLPDIPAHRQDLAASCSNLGLVLAKNVHRADSGRPPWPQEAEEAYRRALHIQESLMNDLPDVPHHRYQLARTNLALGNLLWTAARFDESEQSFRDGLAIMEKLVPEFPDVPQYRLVVGEGWSRLSGLLESMGQEEESEAVARKAVAYFEKLVADSPRIHSYHAYLARSLMNLGEMEDQLLDHLMTAAQLSPRQASYRRLLVACGRVTLGYCRSVSNYRRIIAVLETISEEVPSCRYDLAAVLAEFGHRLREKGSIEEAQAFLDRAERIRREQVAMSPKLPYEYRRAFRQEAQEWGSGSVSSVDYKVRIETAGEYQLYVRCDGHDGASSLFWVWVDELFDGPGGMIADRYLYHSGARLNGRVRGVLGVDADFGTNPWQRYASFEGLSTCLAPTWFIQEPGDYTIHVEDEHNGMAIDAFIFQLVSLPAPDGNGPPESQVTQEQIFLESNGRVVVEAEHFVRRTAFGGNWLVVPDEDPGDIGHLNFRGTGYIQALPDTSDVTSQCEILCRRGEAQLELGHGDRAIADLSKAIGLDPNDPDAWQVRGYAYANLKQWDKALADSSKAIELEPDNSDHWWNRARVYSDMGKSEEAIADFSKVIELDPGARRALDGFAWQLASGPEHLRNPALAVKVATKVVEARPETGSPWCTLGLAYYRNGQYEEALEVLLKSIELEPSGGDAILTGFIVAMTYQQLGHVEESRAQYDQAVEWIKENAPDDDNLNGFRAETEQLLGLTPASVPNKEEVVPDKINDSNE
ncbi:MAG: tetratricopeptide repeat protein [Planctomycetota bacterium]